MRERAYALGGQLELRSTPDVGTTVTIELPVGEGTLRAE
jgi:signal transduction histidine kinase